MEMDKLIQIGEKLGLEGEKLLEFVREQQKLEEERRREEEEKEEKRRQIEEEKEERRRLLEEGHRYILTLVDFATRYPEAIPLKNRELKMETFSGRRRPDWQRKPGTEAAVASRQKSNIKIAANSEGRRL